MFEAKHSYVSLGHCYKDMIRESLFSICDRDIYCHDSFKLGHRYPGDLSLATTLQGDGYLVPLHTTLVRNEEGRSIKIKRVAGIQTMSL